MTDNDDVLTLPVDDDDPGGGAAEGRAGAARAAPQTPVSTPVGRITELVSLSSEARLATALLLQAQAIEGMRQVQTDLLRRLADDVGAASGSRDVEELHASLKDVLGAQQQALRQLSQARRRARRHALLLAGLGVLLVAGAAYSVLHLRDEFHASLTDLRGEVSGELATERSGLQQSLAQAGAEHDRALRDLTTKFQDTEVELRGQLNVTVGARDAAVAELTREQQASGSLRTELSALQAQAQDRERELAQTSEDRVQQIGENTHLRDQLADRDRRLDELTKSIAQLREQQEQRAAAPDGRIVVSQVQGGASLPARITQALRSSGAEHVQVVEGAVADGQLQDLLVLHADESSGPPRIVRAASGRLLVEKGRALLRLAGVHAQEGNASLPDEDIALPGLDAPSWRAVGLQVPSFVPLTLVSSALSALLAPHGYRVTGLQSFDGETLGALELRQEDANGLLLRTVKAARAVLSPVGPELQLADGSIVTNGDERPFFHGVLSLPLPGADFGQWLAAVAPPSP